MKILFDQGTPAPLGQALQGHTCSTAYERGWANLSNGALLAQAEGNFDLLITTDKNFATSRTSREGRWQFWCSPPPVGQSFGSTYRKP